MRARDRHENHRASTPLELLFDLCFVVAVSQAAGRLGHGVVEGHWTRLLPAYAVVFFAIWRAWMNFTWFASAYDTDDVLYRLLTLVQIAGVLILAAGVPAALDDGDARTITLGYVVMRAAMVAQWLRAARADPGSRRVGLRYAAGIALCQVCWLAQLAVPRPAAYGTLPVLIALELLVPLWAERGGANIPWHPTHIAERFGLFALIVLGESVLAATNSIQAAVADSGLSASMLVVSAAGLILLFALWWTYFDRPAAAGLRLAASSAFRWGYGHLLVFACLAAVGAGLQVCARTVNHESMVSDRLALLTLSVPTAIYLAVIGLLHTWINRHRGDRVVGRFSVAALLVLLIALAAPPLPLVAGVSLVAGVVAGLVVVDLLWPGGGSPGLPWMASIRTTPRQNR
jgi:low temperature requirement protein LtrA